MRGAPVRRASVAAPPGRVVRAPKNSTSTPLPTRSRSETSPASWLFLSALISEPLEEPLRFEPLHHRAHWHPLEGEPVTPPLPAAHVGQRHHDALAVGHGRPQVLIAFFEPPVQ